MIRDKDTGLWTNSKAFKTTGDYFLKHGYYTTEPEESPDWFSFWEEERRRCLHGYEVEGSKITGNHYFYLNYCKIQKVDLENIVGKLAKKINSFPDFWDGDYDYFWVREIAKNGILQAVGISKEEQKRIYNLPEEEKLKIYIEHLTSLGLRVKPVLTCENLEGGKDLIIGKARRRGFSYKNSSVGTCNYFHKPFTYTMYMAYEKKYLYPGIKTIFGKTLSYINFINAETSWLMPSDYIDKQNHIKNSYAEYKEGKKIEKGFMSEIEAISFMDNPDAGRGADTEDIIGEEVGAWGTPGGLKKTVKAMRSSAEAGGYKTGMMTLFGTSGDIEGGTADFADMFYRPAANNFMEFYDIYGENSQKIEGFFFPKQINTEGYYDEQGNSDIEGAKQEELRVREYLISKGATNTEILERMQEEPLNSAEAFAMISRNSFPVVELRKQLEKVKSQNLQDKKGTPVELYESEGKTHAKPLLNGKAEPITSLKELPFNLEGCPVIYEHPIEDIPKGLYKIGYDPIRQDTGTSLAAIIVYKSVHKGSFYHDIIVAEYIGRKPLPEDIDRIAELFANLYNTTVMYENEVTGTKNYFRKIKKLNLLAAQPDAVISKNIKNSKVARVYGCHMNKQLKDAGERYIKDWLLTILDYDENGNKITVIDRIYSKRLLEELISYHSKGNYDLVSALIMVLIQVQEESLGKEYISGKNVKSETAKKLIKSIETRYNKRNNSFNSNRNRYSNYKKVVY